MTHNSAANLSIHSFLKKSRANGPGTRAVIWLQGCSRSCPGCFNPNIKDQGGGMKVRVGELVRWIISAKGIEGISISGGEPTDQLAALNLLLTDIREKTDLSILLFSGRSLQEIFQMPEGNKLISMIDVLVDGPYDPGRANPSGTWPSSANQKIHLLTTRYTMTDFSGLPDMEVQIVENGDIIKTGLGVKEEVSKVS